MVTKTLEAPSAQLTREEILKRIPQFEIRPVFLREHLNREIVEGTIGDRGGGKSGSDAVISAVDFMLAGKPVWSNMEIKCDIEVSDDTAKKYGLNYGGVVHYESQFLEKNSLLGLDERYRGGCLVIEEINVQFSNVRRFMTNTNVDFNEVCQQLRKFQTSLIYNVIDEMFIDPQLRALTDVFIKTYDTAFDLDALESKKQTGVDFKWKVYPMSGYLAGEQGRYAVTKKTLPPVFFHFQPWRGIYNSMQHQEKGKYSLTKKEKDQAMMAEISVESSAEMVTSMNEWGWLADIAKSLKKQKVEAISSAELAQLIGRPLTREMKDWLRVFGIDWDRHSFRYKVGKFNLEN